MRSAKTIMNRHFLLGYRRLVMQSPEELTLNILSRELSKRDENFSSEQQRVSKVSKINQIAGLRSKVEDWRDDWKVAGRTSFTTARYRTSHIYTQKKIQVKHKSGKFIWRQIELPWLKSKTYACYGDYIEPVLVPTTKSVHRLESWTNFSTSSSTIGLG